MERETIEIYCKTYHDIPSVERIKQLSRHQRMKVLFSNEIVHDRESIGDKWKKELKNFLIGIPTRLPEISITRLISVEEIIDHNEFFEEYAKDYGMLAKKLITQLAQQLQVEIIPDDPDELICNLMHIQSTTKIFSMDKWRYFVHGYHCRFKHTITGQEIEVPLRYGNNFGALDPYFFTRYINSTPDYYPLPVAIYEDFHDGVRILEIMEKIGKFEKVEGVFKGCYGSIVKDRD